MLSTHFIWQITLLLSLSALFSCSDAATSIHDSQKIKSVYLSTDFHASGIQENTPLHYLLPRPKKSMKDWCDKVYFQGDTCSFTMKLKKNTHLDFFFSAITRNNYEELIQKEEKQPKIKKEGIIHKKKIEMERVEKTNHGYTGFSLVGSLLEHNPHIHPADRVAYFCYLAYDQGQQLIAEIPLKITWDYLD